MNDQKLRELGIIGISGHFGCADDTSLNELEVVIGRRLPNDFRDFLRCFGNSLFEKNVRFRYVEPSPWAVGGYGTMDLFYGLKGSSAYDISRKYVRLSKESSSNVLLPIGHDAGSNLICLGLDDTQYGKVLFWDRETTNCYTIAHSFKEFLNSFEIVK